MSSSSESRKGSRSRSSTSKKSNAMSRSATATATSSDMTAINTRYGTTNEGGLKGVPLYSAVSVSNQYSLLTKGGCVTEYSKETWSTQINVSQTGPEKLPATLTAQRFTSKEFSASLVTSKSSLKTFQITPTPECTANNVFFASTVGRSNTTFAIQTAAPISSATSLSKEPIISQTRPEMKSITYNLPDNPLLRPNPLTTTPSIIVPTSATQKIMKTSSSKNVSCVTKAKDSQLKYQKTSSTFLKPIFIDLTKPDGPNDIDQPRLATNLRKVGAKQTQNKAAPSKTKSVVPPAKKIVLTGQQKMLLDHLKANRLSNMKKGSSNKSSLVSDKSRSKIINRITRKGIKRRKVIYPRFSLIPSYKVVGKDPLIIKKGSSLAVNDHLQIPKRPKLIVRKTLLPKVVLKTVHCRPVEPEEEEDTPFILPRYSPPRYDFKYNIIRKNKGIPDEDATPELETEHICEEIIEYTGEFDKFARAEDRKLRRNAWFSNPGVQNVNYIQPNAPSSQVGLFGVQIVPESLVNTLPNDSITVLCPNNLTEVSATNAFLTFHSTMNACSSSSTATTNVTQTTTTPIVSSFVKETVASTSAELQSVLSSSTAFQFKEPEPSTSHEISKESSSNSSTKTKESKSKSKSKSKESKNKQKESSSKSKSKESSASRKSNDTPSSSKEKVADPPSTETAFTPTNSTEIAVDPSHINPLPISTLTSDTTPIPQPNVASTGGEASTSTSATATATAPPAPNPEDENYDFGDDIRNIMHAFGDSEYPNPESVKMMEVIVREELNGFVYLCELAAVATKATTLHFREAIFTLRREKQRVGRLFRYFKSKEKPKSPKPASTQTTKEPIETYGAELLEIAEEIDETGEYARLFEFGPETTLNDCELRADRIVQRLTMPKFLMFSKARSVSFARKMPRLAEWVVENIHSRIPLSLAFVDILGFLTYEIVAEIMNMAILVRSERIAINPLERIVDMRGLNPDTCMSDPAFFKKRCFGLQSVSEILVQAGELHAMRFKRLKRKCTSFTEELYKQILPIDVREGYLRFANEQLLEPSLSYKCQASKLANRSQRRPRKIEISTKTAKPDKLAI